jgi:hypothetical protein
MPLLSERLGHTLQRGVLAVLDFDPMLLPPATIRPITTLGDQTLQPEFAGFAGQVGPISPLAPAPSPSTVLIIVSTADSRMHL